MSEDNIFESVFPPGRGRPDHLDFWRMSECILHMDGESEEGGHEDVIATLKHFGIVDPDSAVYMATQRGLRIASLVGITDTRTRAAFAGAWLDAFTCGVLFEQAGGTQCPATG